MFEAEDLLFGGKTGRLRNRPQLRNASGGCLVSSASLCESQDGALPAETFPKHRDSEPSFSPTAQTESWCQTQGRYQEHLP